MNKVSKLTILIFLFCSLVGLTEIEERLDLISSSHLLLTLLRCQIWRALKFTENGGCSPEIIYRASRGCFC